MAHNNTVFAQVLKLVPRHEFETLARKHKSGRMARSMTRWGQFVAMGMAQLTGRCSLRDIVSNLAVQSCKLYHLGVDLVTRSSLARVNAEKPWEMYEYSTCLDPIREPHHCRSPWAQASGVRTGRVPRCGIHRDTPRDLRRWFCGLLQQCDVGICLEQPLPAFRAAGDVPGEDLHGARTGRGKNGSGAAGAPRG